MNGQNNVASPCMRTWLDLAEEFIREAGVDTQYVSVLEAFRCPKHGEDSQPEPEEHAAGSFQELEQEIIGRIPFPKFAEKLAPLLADEVDRPQADMFARRIVAVDNFLAEFE